jgi:hypothetical protein
MTSIQLNSIFTGPYTSHTSHCEHRIAAMAFGFSSVEDLVDSIQRIKRILETVLKQRVLLLRPTLDSILELLTMQELLPRMLPAQIIWELLPRLLPEQIIRERLLRLIEHLALLLLKILRFLLSYIRSAGFMNRRRPKCTTMPWEIWPSLVVLWGVCWMFYPPAFYQNGNQRQHPLEDEQLPYFSHGIQPL